MIEIENGRIFVDGVETIDLELIGYAMLDFAENTQGDPFKMRMQDGDVFIEKCVCN